MSNFTPGLTSVCTDCPRRLYCASGVRKDLWYCVKCGEVAFASAYRKGQLISQFDCEAVLHWWATRHVERKSEKFWTMAEFIYEAVVEGFRVYLDSSSDNPSNSVVPGLWIKMELNPVWRRYVSYPEIRCAYICRPCAVYDVKRDLAIIYDRHCGRRSIYDV